MSAPHQTVPPDVPRSSIAACMFAPVASQYLPLLFLIKVIELSAESDIVLVSDATEIAASSINKNIALIISIFVLILIFIIFPSLALSPRNKSMMFHYLFHSI